MTQDISSSPARNISVNQICVVQSITFNCNLILAGIMPILPQFYELDCCIHLYFLNHINHKQYQLDHSLLTSLQKRKKYFE